MDKESLGVLGLHLEYASINLSSPDVFGRQYSGSRKARQMKRKRGAMLHSTIKGKIMKHNMQTKYNRLH